MKNIALTLMYDGSNYFGYQRQTGFLTIQQVVEECISKITKEKITVSGCGRTDSGVHALNYVLSFKTNSQMPVDKYPVALNSILPNDISVKSAKEVSDDFDGRFSVKQKTYIYKIHNSEIPNPFVQNYAYHYKYKLDLEKMKEAAKYIVGTHDFKCFMASGAQVKTTVRTVYELTFEQNGDDIQMSITSNGFLYNMVRIIAGTLMYVGGGKLNPQDVKNIIESKDRRLAGITAPPQGLYLKSVEY
ncbi:MAG: tRNA pseudouridine(38-40) synthase TruA [Clostridia bacterium]|nr:tRNA pseudouridine(38-40) synthase TruA [Clostridia bacterium]